MDELRKGFHHELDEVRTDLVRLAAAVIEAIPRATAVLLNGDLDGANALIRHDDEIDALIYRARGTLLPIVGVTGPSGWRSSSVGRNCEDGGRY